MASTVTQATITATKSHSAATVAYSTTDADTSAGHQVNLSDGRNEVTITVTAEDTTTTGTYTVSINRGVTDAFGWKASDDFDGLITAENNRPRGMWSDGTTMWVTDWIDIKIYAYDMTTKAHDASKDFDTLDAAGNDNPRGIWSDGTTVWVSDYSDEKLYAYDMTTKAHDVSKDFDTANLLPTGIWSDGTTMWVAAQVPAKIYAYDMSTKARDADKDFDTLEAAGNNYPGGIWSNNITMWVAEEDDEKLYAYNMASKARDADKDFNTLNAAGNGETGGIWANTNTMWASDTIDYKIYSYNMPLIAPNTPAAGTPAVTAPNVFRVPAVLSADLTGITDTDGVTGIATNATYKWQRFAANGTTLDTDSVGTGSTYTLTDADAGKTLKVVVSFTDNGGNSEGPLTSAATSAITAAAICAAPSLTGGATFLGPARKIEVGRISFIGSLMYGYSKASGKGSLDNARFTTAASNNYEIVVITNSSSILVEFDTALTADDRSTLVVHICDQAYAFSSSDSFIQHEFTTPLQNWAPHAERTIYLSQDTAAPTFASATVNGTSLVITLSEPLGAAASLANSAFTVKKGPSGSQTTLTLSGTAPVISGSTVTLTLASASSVTATDTNVLVTYTKPGTGTANKLVDAFGNETGTFADQVVTNLLSTTVPDAPTALTATASGTTQINLSWTAPAITGGSAITGYKIEVSSNGPPAGPTSSPTPTAPPPPTRTPGLPPAPPATTASPPSTPTAAAPPPTSTAPPPPPPCPAPPAACRQQPAGPPDQPLLERPGHHRRLRHHRLQDRGLAQRDLRLDRPGRQHQQHRHDLRAHGAYRRQYPPLPRVRHQRQRRRHRLQRRQRHHRHHRARRSDRPHGHGQRDHPDQPLLERPGQHRRLRHHRLQDRIVLRWRLVVVRPRRQHEQYHHHLRAHRAYRRHHAPLPRLRHQRQRRRHRLQRRQRHHRHHRARRPDRPHGNSQRDHPDQPLLDRPASTGGSAITGYKIESSSDGGSSWSDLVADTGNANTTYAHTGLTASSTRHYRVSAINTNGSGTASNVDSATTGTTVPGAPTGLTATASGSTRIDLSWTAPAITGGSAITGYKIESSSDGGSSWTDQVANTSSTATTYAHTGLASGDTRHYRVSAINANGAGTASNVDSATTGTTVPGAPTGLTATASGTTQINLSWSAPASDGGSAITGYKIESSSDGGSSWSDLVADTGNANTTYAHTGLTASSTRHYRVSAINTNGAAPPPTSTAPPPAPPAPPCPVPRPAFPPPPAARTRSTSPGAPPPAAAAPPSPATGSRSPPMAAPAGPTSSPTPATPTRPTRTPGLAAGDTRHYRVSAINANGAGTASNVDSATTGTTVPGAPTGLTATASGTTQIDLSWTAPGSTGGSAITGYKIEVSSNGGSSWTNLVANTGNANTTYAHTGLGAGDTRHYRVSAINANGSGTASNVDSATTGTTAPGAPTGLSATASGSNRINLSWTAPAITGGSAITGYKIEVSSNGGSSWTDQVANTSSTTTTYAHTGLTAGTTRHYRVSAINTNGAGTASNTDSATTAAAGETTVTFTGSSYTASEGQGEKAITVELSAPPSARVRIPLAVTHLGGATAADYSGVPSSLTFAAGRTRFTFGVTATDDSHADGGESVRIGFGTLPAGYAPGARRTATVTLEDNDNADLLLNFGTERHTTVKVRESDTVWHRFTLSLSTSRYGPPNGNPQQPVTIPLVVTHRGGATPADYEVRGRRTLTSVTFGVGESVTSFSMRAIPDGRRETGEGLRLDFGRLPAGVSKGDWGPYETIAFVDQELPRVTASFGAESYTATEGGAPARVSIHLNEPVEIEPLVVRLVVTHVGATAADYTGIPKSVTFGVGEQTQTITVRATDDTDDDDGESVTLSFVNDPNGRVRVRTGPASATVALADNDGLRRVTVSFGAATYTATEGGADATVRVELDVAPGRSVTVPLTKAHLGNATAADYSVIPADVTFAANQRTMTFAVMATADQIADGGESVSIGFGTLPEGVFAGSPAATTVTLADGGEQRLVANFGSSRGHAVQVREGARRLRLNVLLNSSPRRPVTIPLVVTHVGGATAADYADIPKSVTFAAGQTSSHYYVRALPDLMIETGEGLRIDFGPLPPGVRKGTWGPYETIEFVDP